jgi:uncharacterized protein YbbC (DUF1343 family)
MLRNVDVIAVDLQDLAVRCYTYVSTLRYVLDAAARLGKTIIIADRPVPFATTLDGPVTQPGFESMVAHVHTPMVYGMTPGESARWIAASYGYDIDLRIARATAYRRNTMRPRYTAGWIPPSPAIASWETAWCYPMTVFTEALPAVDCGRGTRLPFQLIGAPWMKGPELAEHLNGLGLPGILFHPHVYAAPLPPHKDQLLNGVRIAITNPRRLRPVQAGVAIVGALQTLYGKRRLWSRDSRPDFFDRLYGTDEVRIALKDGASHASIARSWQTDLRRFNRSRKQHLLYR